MKGENNPKIYEKEAKSIINKTKIPGADWAVNHYSGCAHSCVYCYARFVCRWRDEDEDWGEFVDVKTNAAELTKKQSKGKEGTVILCTTADPYQPIEEDYRLTRKVLQNLNPELKLSILTKSDLILRDMDVFLRFENHEFGLTITTLDEDKKKVFEPFSPSSHARLEALKKLKEEGFKIYAFIGPILPCITNLERIFEEVSPYSDKMMFEDLNLQTAKGSIFKTLDKNFPELKQKYKNLSDDYWLKKQKEIKELGEKFDTSVKIYFKHTGSLKFD